MKNKVVFETQIWRFTQNPTKYLSWSSLQKQLTIFVESSILDVWQDFEYRSQIYTFEENSASWRTTDRKFRSDLGEYSFQDTQFIINHKMYLDINECDVLNGGCQYHCKNTNGSYVCQCSKGFFLDGNGKTCSGNFDN